MARSPSLRVLEGTHVVAGLWKPLSGLALSFVLRSVWIYLL